MKNFTLVIASVLVVLIATLSPFNFYFPDTFSLKLIITSFDNSSSFEDVVNNILLFMPLGFSSTAVLQRKKMRFLRNFLIVTFISTGLSSLVEILQIFLSSRTPTPDDIVNNTIGGIVGMICFYMWHSKSFIYILSLIENSRLNNSIKQITLLFIGYIFIAFLISILCQSTTNLTNWNLNYPLVLGNENTGDRPWYGYISKVQIADRAFSQSEVSHLLDSKTSLNTTKQSLIADYELTDNKRYQDNTGQMPELLLQGHSSNIRNEKGVALSSSHWLKTKTPATFLNKRIRQTSEFTIFTTVATADTNQTGPARIISVSRNGLSRNFTLGQQESNLDLRIRTSITGENGADIKLNAPDIFTDTNPHNIVITYSKAAIQVYIDKLNNSYLFNLLELIPKNKKVFYYGLTFIPLGIFLGFLTLLAKKRLIFYRLLLFSGIVLPSLILEIVLVIYSGKSISIENLLMGILFIAGTMLMLRLRASRFFNQQV
ncbi:MAG: VanZ family protein [Cyanomargarita calcarea GSE-NOS-MK-12-04C]|jgi:VanZ family protein|uniref:VanZ family protein n=1 Tax=Cyanomargarita calcarea GSE-NOS-MK-12-04C TaxID=2839659 RepID=A0A951QQY1_9CYAN|nr:VanZ family protein [Cyanomargarita calcarea GSE-NOS-MK-12-04C]